MTGAARHLSVAAGAALLLVVGGARPAAADPPEPSDYRSRIDSIEPDVAGIDVEIIGGDSFLRLTVDRAHTAIVEGYDGEPYLQFLADGTVQQNQRSTATYLNEDRYGREGEVDVPEGLDPDDPPQWQTIDDDGEHAWHDHRIHWMSPDRPPDVGEGDIVQTQPVPLEVDGEPVAVTVSVILEPGESPLPWIAVGAAGAAVALVAGWRRRSLLVAVVAAAAGTGLAVVAGQGERAAVPSGVGGSPLVLVVPAIGLAATLLAAVVARRQRALAGVALLAGAATLAGWALLRLSVLWKPVLPTELPANLDRIATALAVGLGIAVATLTLRSGAVTPAPLTDDD